MRLHKKVTIRGRELEISELTVAEVVKLIDNLSGGLVGLMFDESLPVEIAAFAAGLKMAELEEWYPSEIAELIEAATAANPHSARLAARLRELIAPPPRGEPGPAPAKPAPAEAAAPKPKRRRKVSL